MRRVYYTGKSAGIRASAIDQFRRTRAKISADHPGLLNELHEKIIGGQKIEPVENFKIDRIKTFATLKKLLELKAPSAEFSLKLEKVLQENQ
jgi:hypothetical protein